MDSRELTAVAPIAVPLLGAAVIAGISAISPRRLVATLAIAFTAVTVVGNAVLLAYTSESPVVYWFGDWEPRDGFAIGISLTIDSLGAGLSLFAAILTLATFVYSIRYFEKVITLYHVIVLVLLAGMSGIALTGDLFNLFVFIELVSVSAFALTAHRIEARGPLQGAINFAITNSIGAFFFLWGIGLLYARTSSLNLAYIGQQLSGQEPDGLVVAAFTCLVVGLLIKAAIVPFHFWLADAYASAPAPVTCIFAGVLSELGLFAIARLYSTGFEGALGNHADALRLILTMGGALTALIGGLMCIVQHRLKRLLAFAVISHAGLFLIGVALLTPHGLAGAAVYLVADGFVKASLFLCVGIINHRFAESREHELHARGRELAGIGVLLAVGGLALVGIPPIATFVGKTLIEEEAAHLGLSWTYPVFVAASCLTGAAVLRAVGRIFLGLGPPEPEDVGEDDRDASDEEHEKVPATMWIPAAVLMSAAVAMTFAPGLVPGVEAASEQWHDRPAYIELVLEGRTTRVPPPGPGFEMTATAAAVALVSAAAAVGLALVLVKRMRLSGAVRRVTDPAVASLRFLRVLHSGHPGDYVAWLTVGAASLGGLLALAL